MDIQKEKEAFQKFCEENFDFERHEQTYFDEQTQCYENDIGEDTESINMAWSAWQAAKADAVNQPDQMTISFDRFQEPINKAVNAVSKTEVAVPEWIDYAKQSPRIDGRYQIFINGEQITADWQSPYGFSDPIEGDALIQGLISHWAMLPKPPKTQEQSHV